MPRTTYRETHENILRCAREAFLADGYERASLRGICAAAGVTIGAFYRHFPDKQALFAALVQPGVDAFMEVYRRACTTSSRAIGQGDLAATRAVNLEADRAIIGVMYDNRTAFELLVRCSGGTPFAGFVDDLAEQEVAVTLDQYEELERTGVAVRRMDPDQIRTLSRAHFSCTFDPIAHGRSRDEALASAEAIATFFWAGWRALMEAPDDGGCGDDGGCEGDGRRGEAGA